MAVIRFRLPSVSYRRWCGIALLFVTIAVVNVGSAIRPSEARVLIPVGSSAVAGPHRLAVVVDGQPWSAVIVADGYGGSWLDVGSLVSRGAAVVLRMTVPSRPLTNKPGDAVPGRWVMPSRLIDSTDPVVVAAARHVTAHETSVSGMASAIHAYVASTLDWRRDPVHREDPASRTLTLGYGTCANFARLFVALCRAVGIPARTIQGVIFDTELDSYHQWAEFRDTQGVWHLADPTTDASHDRASRLYVDLISSPEENPLWTDPSNVIVYDTTHEPHDGRLGFRVIHQTPITATIENTYTLDGLMNTDAP